MAGKPNTAMCARSSRQKEACYQVPPAFDRRLLPFSMGTFGWFSESAQQPSAKYRGKVAKKWRQNAHQAVKSQTVSMEHENQLCQSIFATVCINAFPKKSFVYNLVR